MIYDPETLGLRLRQCRNIRGFKQSEVAQRLDVSTSYYSMVERGKKNISVAQLMEFADMHGLPVSVVIGESVELTDATQGMSQMELDVLRVFRSMDDKSKKQFFKHLQIMLHPEIEVVDKPKKAKQ